MNKNDTLKLFIISDAIGDTAQKITTAVLAQFPELTNVEVQRFAFIDSKEELLKILRDALQEHAIVASTLVKDSFNEAAHEFAARTSLSYVDFMTPMMELIQGKTGLEPKHEARAQHKLTSDYFAKIEAIDFAVKYDDGQDPKGFLKADYVIIGPSRTSKTPLSMYLANKSYKVANLPLIPEIPLPKEIFDVPKEKLIGLVATPEVIQRTREKRLSSLGLGGSSSYTDVAHIKEEMDYAKEIYHELGAKTVEVDDMSIEEIAEYITRLQIDR
ncbi:pyruvate, water dikinase regulatory protein [Tetragenococcus koreensis]|uniref:pyruvate, water dikinase regulatory protein n=1 Tax=Tetragenococcus koreensis TaxID=290335 RepID=UPI000F4DD85D|nr:pyruvate, water dikinase regulatory protein [Tetragenococcus koreensis]AYW45982.1 phosphoenolpyruvate synthase regulatory protein [Tetragenococcus koreensis]GEN90863.1 putative pyruvate, phosphate dikinase regulatory protein 1 [Tetragenococcus koreensis]